MISKETWRNSVRAADASHNAFCRTLRRELNKVFIRPIGGRGLRNRITEDKSRGVVLGGGAVRRTDGVNRTNGQAVSVPSKSSADDSASIQRCSPPRTAGDEILKGTTMSEESTLNVKLDQDTREKLNARAEREGRAACREAAAIIKKAVNK